MSWKFNNKGESRVPNYCVIHHIDGNSSNDNPENLQLMTRDFHNKLHIF
jgi:hypothetical protein